MHFFSTIPLIRLPARGRSVSLLLAVILFFTLSHSAQAQTTIDVTTTTDEFNTDGDCSLREAIIAANYNVAVDECAAGSETGSDVINVPAGTYILTIRGTSETNSFTGDLNIFSNVTINGASAATTIVNGNAIDRVFDIASGATAQINDLTIMGGGGVVFAAGVQNAGNLTIVRSTIRNNKARTGGGIMSSGTLTLVASTVSNNIANAGGIGGLGNTGVANLINTTIADNIAPNSGGIDNGDSARITFTNVTVSNNKATAGFEGITNAGQLTFFNTIVHNKCFNFYAGYANSNSHHNLFSDSRDSCGFFDGENNSKVGVNPLLGNLTNNLGPTFTKALLEGSPALDAGDADVCASSDINNLDQRGVARPIDGDEDLVAVCDMGAFEAGFPKIAVSGNNQLIVNGDNTPSSSDDTDVGSVNVNGSTAVHTFTIENIGHATLNITSTTLSGANAADFSISQAPASSVAEAGFTTFQLTFDPSATGTRTAIVSIANNDNDRHPYTFAVQGVGVLQYSVISSTRGTGSGAVTLDPTGGVYAAGTIVTATATAHTGSTFTNWSGACSGSGLCVVTMNADQRITATFTLNQYALTTGTTGTGSGTINRNPLASAYDHGTMVTITAAANSGSTFAGWAGDCTGTGDCVLTMTSAKRITATFNLIPYSLITGTTGTGSGSITLDPPGGTYNHGTAVTATAVAKSGSTFTGWSGACSGTGACVVTVDAQKHITATFELNAINQYTLLTATAGTGSGTLKLNPTGSVYNRGTVVTVIATPASNALFTGWSGACSGAGSCAVTMDANKALTATFALKQYTLLTVTTGTGSGTLNLNPTGGVYNHGAVVTVTATPASNALFTGWSGACSGAGSCAVTMDANKALTATFALKQYTLLTATTGTGSGTLKLNPTGGVYNHGAVVTVTAAPASNALFTGWSGACSGAGSCVVTMDANKALTATFASTAIPRISLAVERLGTGTVAPGTIITYQVTISNVGSLPIQLTNIQGAPQQLLQGEAVAQSAALDAPCTVPITLAVAAVHNCTLNWRAAGNNRQTVNYVVTVTGTANSQSVTATGATTVALATPDSLSESEEPQRWLNFLPLVER